MDVRMDGEMVRKRLYELGNKTQAQMAEKLDCDEGTCRRILKGNPVREKTAEKVCNILELDKFEVIVFELKSHTLQIDLDEQIIKYQHVDERSSFYHRLKVGDNKEIPEVARMAAVAAGQAMDDTFKSHQDNYSVKDVIYVFSALISASSVQIARKSRTVSLFFVDEIARMAKKVIYTELSKLEVFDHLNIKDNY